MPSSATITSFYSFAALTTIRSSEVNTNFSNFRGHLLPIDPSTATAATTMTYDLGSTDHAWAAIYGKNLNLFAHTTGVTPPSGYYNIYVKSTNNKLTLVNDAGAETSVGGGAGGINYFSETYDAENGTTGWSTYADGYTTTGMPTDGTGGSAVITWTTTSTTPLRDDRSFLFTKGATSTAGDGVKYDFTIDAADKGKVLQGSFEYYVDSGTYADDEMQVWVYDVTNAKVIPCAPYKIKNSSLIEKFPFEFQTSIDSTSYRLMLHVAGTSTSAYTMKFDNFNVGPQAKLYGSPITDWVSYTPTGTWSTNTTYTGEWRQVGDSIEIVAHIAVSGAPTGSFTVNIPSGYSIDTNKLVGSNAAIGTAWALNNAGNARYTGTVVYNSTTSVTVVGYASTSGWSATVPHTFASGDFVDIKFSVPIQGWSSSQRMSHDANTRVVAARYGKSGTQAVTTGVNTITGWAVSDGDTHSGFSSDKYYFKVSGWYSYRAEYLNDTTAVGIPLYRINGGTDIFIGTDASGRRFGGSAIFYANAGDYLENRFYTGSNVTIQAGNDSTWFSVDMINGPSQVMASDTVACRYTSDIGHSLTNGALTVIVFEDKDYDSTNSYNSSTGKYYPPVPGLFQIDATTTLVTTSSGGEALITIRKNGATYVAHGTRLDPTAAQYYGLQVSDTINLLPTDYIEITVYHTNGVGKALEANSASNHLSIKKVGNYA